MGAIDFSLLQGNYFPLCDPIIFPAGAFLKWQNLSNSRLAAKKNQGIVRSPTMKYHMWI